MVRSCEKCNGNGYYEVLEEGALRAGYCDCLEGRRFYWQLPRRFVYWTWDTFPGDTSAKDRVRAWSETGTPPWLLLCGSVGSGKTGLAVCAYKAFRRRKEMATVWRETSQLLEEIKRTFDDDDPALEDYGGHDPLTWFRREAEFLVLDDLGAERPTEWAQETMRQILHGRYDHMLYTIITTNLSGSELESWVGKRTMDRIRHDTMVVTLRGESLREPKVAA